MAVLSCPKCPTTLRVPDGASGNVKCPKCETLFPVRPPFGAANAAPSPPARPPFGAAKVAPPPPARPPFGAAKTAPVPPPPLATPKPAPVPAPPITAPPPPREEPLEQNFEIVDALPIPKKKIVVVDEDDILEEPRKKQKRDEDEDDTVRSRRKRKPRRSEDDDDDEENWRVQSPGKKGHGNAKVGMLLLTISSWLYFSLYVLFTLCVFLLLVGYLFAVDESSPRPRTTSTTSQSGMMAVVNVMLILIGLIGLGNWVVSLVGFSFCIAGPPRSRTSAITATSIAGVHLVLVGLSYAITSDMMNGISRLGNMQSPSWLIFATTLPFLDSFLPMLVYGSRGINGEYLVIILTGVCEVVRLIFSLVTIRSVATAAKNYAAAERAQVGIVAASIIIGGGLIVMLLVSVLIREANFSNLKAVIGVGLGAFFILCVAYTVMLLVPALTAGSTRSALSRRNR